MLKEPFVKAIPVLEKIEKAGFEAYFVGGSVRDYCMNKEIQDVDIATSAKPEDIKEIFPKTVDVGIEHGTVLVLYGGESYEITTFRTEGTYVDHRHPDEVTFVQSLEEDLKRRDFTMNAIAMTKDGVLIDPFSGKQDIECRIIRSVGNPEERFSEDALRMLRAVRFVSQLGFELDGKTKEALAKLAPLLEHIAVERKLVELGKLLVGVHKTRALHLLVDLGLHRYLPCFSDYHEEIKQVADLTFDHPLTENEMWALLVICTDQHQNPTFFRQWKMSTKKMKEIQGIIQGYKWRVAHDWTPFSLYQLGLEFSLSAEKIYGVMFRSNDENPLGKIVQTYQHLPIKNRKELAVTGNDLMEWEKKPRGPWIKERLEAIEKAVVEGKLENEKMKIKEWLNL